MNEDVRSLEPFLIEIQPIFHQTPKSFDVSSEEEEEEEALLIRKKQGTRGSNIPHASDPKQGTAIVTHDHVAHTHAHSNEERKRKGKGKLVKSCVKESKRQYGTRSATQKVLGSAMLANAAQKENRSQ